MFSIVIPVKEINDYVRENVGFILQQTFKDWELVVVTNDLQRSEWSDERVSVIPSGRVGPAEKRDLGARQTSGEVIVFLDDDSYPDENYLQKLSQIYSEPSVEAVGGPGLTPLQDSFRQKVSGAIFLSRLTGGVPERYISYGVSRVVDDWPSVNLSVRRSSFIEVGGFGCTFWPGEDTFFCKKLLEHGVQIRYEPSVIVWHHRREGLRRHLLQIGRYGMHRGYFARHHASNSRRVQYFAPSGLVLLVIGTILGPLLPATLRHSLQLLVGIYFCIQVIGLLQISHRSSAAIALAAAPYVLLSHLWYGVCFLRGLVRVSPPQVKLR